MKYKSSGQHVCDRFIFTSEGHSQVRQIQILVMHNGNDECAVSCNKSFPIFNNANAKSQLPADSM